MAGSLAEATDHNQSGQPAWYRRRYVPLKGLALLHEEPLAAASNLLEEIDQALDAGRAGRHQPQPLDQAVDVRVVQGKALDHLAVDLELDGRPARHVPQSADAQGSTSMTPWPPLHGDAALRTR